MKYLSLVSTYKTESCSVSLSVSQSDITKIDFVIVFTAFLKTAFKHTEQKEHYSTTMPKTPSLLITEFHEFQYIPAEITTHFHKFQHLPSKITTRLNEFQHLPTKNITPSYEFVYILIRAC